MSEDIIRAPSLTLVPMNKKHWLASLKKTDHPL